MLVYEERGKNQANNISQQKVIFEPTFGWEPKICQNLEIRMYSQWLMSSGENWHHNNGSDWQNSNLIKRM